MATRPGKKADDSLPFYDGSLYLIATRTVQALRQGTGVRGKLGGASRQLAAIGPHTRRRWRALSVIARGLVAVVLVAAGVGAAGLYVWLSRPSAPRLREQIRAELVADQLPQARRHLQQLERLAVLTREDRRDLARPLQLRVAAQARALRVRIEAARKASRWDEALAALEDWEDLELDGAWAAFTRAEVLRSATRRAEAAAAYARYLELYPDSERADDAMFWQALTYREQGDAEMAKELLEELVTRYPRSNFLASSRRMLGELEAKP